MNITRNKLFPSLILLQLFVGLLFIFNNNYLLLRTILSFIYFLSVPGLLLLLILKVTKTSTYEYFSYMISLSLSFLLFGGLALNILLPMLGIFKPLSDIPLLIGLNSFILTLTPIAYFRNKQLKLVVKNPNISPLSWILLGSTLLFPALSIFGANILNNGGTNLIATSMIIGIAIFILLLTSLRKKLDDKIYPLIILAISTSLLLSYSLRSWHILGWDINEEYHVFQLTKQAYLWSVSSSQNVYNSCLSITILPTIFHTLLKINDEYIFKIIYQLLFTIVPLNIYLLVKRYTNSLYAFFACLLFMIQQTFYLEMTAVTRQEVALIFFASSTLILFNNTLSTTKKHLIFLLLSLSMVISHYSTTYIALILFLLTYIISVLFKLIIKVKSKKNTLVKQYKFHLNFMTLILLLIATISWNIFITKSYSNITESASSVLKNIEGMFTLNDKSSIIQSFLLNKKVNYTNEQLDKFIQNFSSDFLSKNKIDTIMKGETTNKENLHIVNLYPLKKNTSFETFALLPYTISKYLTLIGLLVGIIYIIQNIRKNKVDIDIEYIIIAIISLLLLIIMVVLPSISVTYNIERLFQQSLIFTSIFIIFGILLLLKRLTSFSLQFLSFIIIIYYLFQSGITAPLTNGVLRTNLFNEGFEYDAHYTHPEDIQATIWLNNDYDKKSTIYTDRLTHIKVDAYSSKNLPIVEFMLPNLMDKFSYIFAGYTNTKKRVASFDDDKYFNKGVAFVNFPFDFLNKNKDLIYNNGGAKIYR